MRCNSCRGTPLPHQGGRVYRSLRHGPGLPHGPAHGPAGPPPGARDRRYPRRQLRAVAVACRTRPDRPISGHGSCVGWGLGQDVPEPTALRGCAFPADRLPPLMQVGSSRVLPYVLVDPLHSSAHRGPPQEHGQGSDLGLDAVREVAGEIEQGGHLVRREGVPARVPLQVDRSSSPRTSSRHRFRRTVVSVGERCAVAPERSLGASAP